MRKLNTKQMKQIKKWVDCGIEYLDQEHYTILEKMGLYENLDGDVNRYMIDLKMDKRLKDNRW